MTNTKTLSHKIELTEIKHYDKQILIELDNPKSYQCPVVIRYSNNTILLFFFYEKLLKKSFIYDVQNKIWHETNYKQKLVAVCVIENKIYAKDNQGNVFELRQKKQEV